MQNLNEIKNHISAVEQTGKITNAMYLLSTSRMKRALVKAEYNRDYYRRARATMKDIIEKSATVEHPYLTVHGVGKPIFVIMASDKGLAGAYNANIMNYALKLIEQKPDCYIMTIGIMASVFLKKHGRTPDIEILGVAQNPVLYSARDLERELFQMFTTKQVNEVYLVFTRFFNSALQQPAHVKVLPLDIHDYLDVEVEHTYTADMIYEPSPQAVFDALVPQYAVGIIYGALVQAYASEQSARMTAMQSATRNADEMLKKLRSKFSIARQFAITQEISEITAAAEALAKKGAKHNGY